MSRLTRFLRRHEGFEEKVAEGVGVGIGIRIVSAALAAGVASAAITVVATHTSTVYHPPYSLSLNGAALVERFEGVRYHPYNDATSPPVCTVGVGHAFRPFHPCSAAEFRETFTRGQVAALLMHDVSWAEHCVRDSVTHPIDQPQFDALVSFTFNIGCGGFERSSVLGYVNAGNTAGVPGRLILYDHAGAVELAGLKTRRIAEAHLYVTGDYGPGIGRYEPPKPPKPLRPPCVLWRPSPHPLNTLCTVTLERRS